MTAWICLFIGLSLGVVVGWCLHARLTVPDAVTPRPLLPDPAPVQDAVVRPARVVPPPKPNIPDVAIQFRDGNERHTRARVVMPITQRRPTLYHAQRKYVCARQDASGDYIYREVRF